MNFVIYGSVFKLRLVKVNNVFLTILGLFLAKTVIYFVNFRANLIG